jgi:sugar lactone lactonase YvrE
MTAALSLQPVRWRPPKAPPRARVPQSSPAMPRPRRIELPGAGPEDVVVDPTGVLYTGVADGRILRVSAEGNVDVLAQLEGRALGLEVLPDGNLIACNTRVGLEHVDTRSGAVTRLVDTVEGAPMLFCSNVVSARDGTLYFSESSQRYPLDTYRSDLIEHSGTGRLMRRDPNGTVTVILRGLDFANGLRLADDESHLVIAETGGYRLTRLWLRGERAGSTDVLIDNLPGFPDNLGRGSGGTTWVALPSPRDPIADRLLAWPPWMRKVAWALPQRLQPQPKRTAWVLQVDAQGQVVRDLQRPGDEYFFVTGVCEHDGWLYLSSLVSSALAVIDL